MSYRSGARLGAAMLVAGETGSLQAEVLFSELLCRSAKLAPELLAAQTPHRCLLNAQEFLVHLGQSFSSCFFALVCGEVPLPLCSPPTNVIVSNQ